MEDDIFKLLMIVLLMANDKTGSSDNVLTELNTIIILGLIMGQNRNNNTGNNNNNICPKCSSSIDDPIQPINRNGRVGNTINTQQTTNL